MRLSWSSPRSGPWLHLSRMHHPPTQQTVMTNRNALIVCIIIIIGSFGCLLALNGSFYHPSPPASSRPPQGITTFWTLSAPPWSDEKNSGQHRTEVENIVTCKFVLWRRYCRVVFVPKVSTLTPATTEITARRTTMAIEKSAITKVPYNRNRGILG